MIFYGLTDKGRMRPQNEDFLFASDLPVGGLPNLFAVADGMGGHNAGEYASECAIEALLECLRRENEKDPVRALSSAVSFANEKVYDIGARDPSKAGMGTTIVCAVFGGDTLTVMNVGDSRVYRLRDGKLQVQLTSAPLRQNLMMEHKRIAQKLNDYVGSYVINDVSFF